MGKKKSNLSKEEALAQALVPESEWPYKVPENWVWTKLRTSVEVIMGQSPCGEDTTYDNNYTGLIGGAADMGDLYPNVSRYTLKPTKLSQNDDVILSIRATLGRPIFSDGVYCLGRGVAAIRSSVISSSYIRSFVINFENHLYDVATGTTFSQVSKTDLESMPFPLPPLAEQQRIVDRIESLFEKLDQAKGLIQDALDSFENRKAAILHKAFSGELTRKWREENGVGLESWECKAVYEYITKVNQGWSPKCEQYPSVDENTWGVIKTTAIQHLKFNEVENKQLPSHLLPKVQHELLDNDILITRAGPRVRVGVCCLVKSVRKKLLLCDKAYRFRAIEGKILPEYLVMYLNSPDILNEINDMKTGISESGVNLTQIGFTGIKIKVPTLNEQREIVTIVDSILEREEVAYDISSLIDNIDLIKKAILASAFRGELGTNDPEDVSALELLKEVIGKIEQ